MKSAVRVAITGAAGNIGYAAAFRVAAGNMLGADQPVILQLIEIPPALGALKGVEINASKDVKVLVVGNPANTNALIACNNAPDLDPSQFTSMMRLDHNRAISQLASKTGAKVTDINKMVVWGNHSLTQFPDIGHCTVEGKDAKSLVDDAWYKEDFMPKVQKRGAEIINARGASSAASAASAAIDHMRDWVLGTNDWVSMGMISKGDYGIAEGLMYSFPVTCNNESFEVVQGLNQDDFSIEMMKATEKELLEEREAVKALL